MSKFIDADRLKRSVESIGLIPQKQADYNEGRNDVKMMVLDLIDTLQLEQEEQKELPTLRQAIEEQIYNAERYPGVRRARCSRTLVKEDEK